MSMTKSRYRIDQERTAARERALAPFLAMTQDFESRYPTMLAIKREVERYRHARIAVWTIWLGPDEYAAWRSEFADHLGIIDQWDGIPIVQVQDAGLSVMAEPLED